MNKTELIAAAAERSGLTKKDAEKVLNAAIDAISAALVQGDKAQVSGFGIFEVKVPQPPHRRGHGDCRLQGARLQGQQDPEGRCEQVRCAWTNT